MQRESHMIFQKFPINTDTEWLLSDRHYDDAVSRWALDLLLEQCKDRKLTYGKSLPSLPVRLLTSTISPGHLMGLRH